MRISLPVMDQHIHKHDCSCCCVPSTQPFRWWPRHVYCGFFSNGSYLPANGMWRSMSSFGGCGRCREIIHNTIPDNSFLVLQNGEIRQCFVGMLAQQAIRLRESPKNSNSETFRFGGEAHLFQNTDRQRYDFSSFFVAQTKPGSM